jgi:glycosyltransferase involved in cell wall biosynthesis
MNILFFSELFYPHGGGAELATYLYAKLLSEEGINVTVVTNRFAGEPAFSKNGLMVVYRLPLFKNTKGMKYAISRRLDFYISSFVRKLLKNASVIYVPRLWYSMILACKAYRKPVIVHIHDYAPICPLAVLYDWSKENICERNGSCSLRCICEFEKMKNSSLGDVLLSTSFNLVARVAFMRVIEQADAVLCVSEAQKAVLVRNMPIISQKSRVVYNPLPDLSPVGEVGECFGYFGGANLLKGFGVLCHAVAQLNDPLVKVYATGFSELDGRMVKSLAKIGMVLRKRIEYREQEAFYKQIRCVIFPSIVAEPLPYVTAEAILRARVLIASNVGGVSEQVQGCKGVFLFKTGDHQKLMALIEYVNGLDRETVGDLGCQNWEVFTKTFSNEKTISGFMSVVDSLT